MGGARNQRFRLANASLTTNTSGATRLKRFQTLLIRKKYAPKFGLAGQSIVKRIPFSERLCRRDKALVGVKPSRQIQLGRAPDRYECCHP